MGVQIEFKVAVPPGDPSERPVTFLGKRVNLEAVPYDKVSPYLGDKVTEEVM